MTIIAAASLLVGPFVQDIPSLIDQLSTEDSYPAQRTLVRIGKPAVPALVRALESAKDYVPELAAECLGAIGDASAADALMKKYRAPGGSDSIATAEAIGLLGTRTCLDALLAELVAADSDESLYAASAGVQRYGVKAFDVVAPLLDKEPKENAEIEILALLSLLDEKRATPHLLRALDDPVATIRMAACTELGYNRTREAAPRIARLLKDASAEVRISAIDALGWLGDPGSIELLAPLLKDSDEDIVATTAYALGNIIDRRSIAALEPIRAHESELVRDEVEFALERLGVWANAEDFARNALTSFTTWGTAPEARAFFAKIAKAELSAELEKRYLGAPKRSALAMAYAFQLGILGENPSGQIARIGEACKYVEDAEIPTDLAYANDYAVSAVDEILVRFPSARALAAAVQIDADGHMAEELYETIVSAILANVSMALEATSLIEDGEEVIAESLCYAALADLSEYLSIDKMLREAESSGPVALRAAAGRIRVRWEALLDE
jgi:HEAT repeat protein